MLFVATHFFSQETPADGSGLSISSFCMRLGARKVVPSKLPRALQAACTPAGGKTGGKSGENDITTRCLRT